MRRDVRRTASKSITKDIWHRCLNKDAACAVEPVFFSQVSITVMRPKIDKSVGIFYELSLISTAEKEEKKWETKEIIRAEFFRDY